ncbi:MAG: transglycosylase SLT domain-containing protein [Pseudomonadota bacterium]
MKLFGSIALACALLFGAPPSRASTDIAAICDAAGVRAAQQTGVPVNVLRAITRTETGRARNGKLSPWPWTVNMEGLGKWFDNREEALAYVLQHHSRGARSYDVGCFQINYRWHGNAFASIEAMFDPATNALYAAQFLQRLYAEKGSWPKAAAAYHSRTPKFANRYRARFERIMARLSGQDVPPPIALSQPGVIPDIGATGGGPLPIPGVPQAVAPPPLPIDVAGPLTVSPPPASRMGSTAGIVNLPAGRSLISGARKPLF